MSNPTLLDLAANYAEAVRESSASKAYYAATSRVSGEYELKRLDTVVEDAWDDLSNAYADLLEKSKPEPINKVIAGKIEDAMLAESLRYQLFAKDASEAGNYTAMAINYAKSEAFAEAEKYWKEENK